MQCPAVISLTFDDGPEDRWTGAVLDALVARVSHSDTRAKLSQYSSADDAPVPGSQ